jgi:hypothetical protein
MRTPFVAIAYFVYLPVVIFLTWYVARTLFKNGKIFMLDIFQGRLEIATSTTKLFELGFYLLNVGFALVIMKISYVIVSQQELLEVLSKKLGGYSIYLGCMLFLNVMLFFKGKGARKKREQAQIKAEWMKAQLQQKKA